MEERRNHSDALGAMSLHVGETFGDYQVVSIVGAGGVGQVFQVEHRLTKRRDAAKILSVDQATEVQIQRFERELAVQARLNHPNIAAVHNALRVEGRLILIMEFVEGRTLEALMQNGRIPMETGVEYIRQTLAALQYAHDQGVVHRDVNPANLIITPNGTVKLTDFGFAKRLGDSELTNFGDLVGSVRYLAPEQVRGGSDPDPRSDLFATGVILYEVLTGKPPFGEDRLAALLTNAEGPPPAPTSIDSRLAPRWDKIVLKALARDPGKRHQSARDFMAALQAISKPPVPRIATVARALKKNISAGAWIGLSAARLLLLGIIAAVTLTQPAIVPPAAKTFLVQPPQGALRLAKRTVHERVRARKQSLHAKAVPRPAKAKAVSGTVAALPAPPPLGTAVDSAPPAALLPDIVIGAPAEPAPIAPSPEPKRKKFWNKINPFKKKQAGSTTQDPSH
jgi:hypothetical protein